jgi:hypothetical protein
MGPPSDGWFKQVHAEWEQEVKDGFSVFVQLQVISPACSGKLTLPNFTHFRENLRNFREN